MRVGEISRGAARGWLGAGPGALGDGETRRRGEHPAPAGAARGARGPGAAPRARGPRAARERGSRVVARVAVLRVVPAQPARATCSQPSSASLYTQSESAYSVRRVPHACGRVSTKERKLKRK